MRTERTVPVPVADRAYPPPSLEEDSEQQTIWYNPLERNISLTLYTETPKPTPGRKPRTLDERRGTKTFVFKAKEERALPSSFDRQVQQTQCSHVDCLQNPFDCKSTEEGHEKRIVGGWGPLLENRGTQRVRLEPGFITLDPALDDAEARRLAARRREFEEYERGKMAEERTRVAAEARARAEAEIREREESAARERLKTEAAETAAELVESRTRKPTKQ